MRLVSETLNNALKRANNAPANFGLLFNKMLEYPDGLKDFKPEVHRDRWPLIDQYKKSRRETDALLKERHLRQAAYCRNMEKAGCKSFVFHAKLKTPFITGLGMSHPTETCLVIDYTIGVPYIPATGQKGVLRLAHLVNTLLDDNGKERNIDQLIKKGVVSKGKKEGELFWNEDDAFKTLFGYSGEKDSLAGQLVVLDAYSLTTPELAEEILNPHYPDYYKKNRGPTEDQSPIPIKFLVIRPGAEFVFRVLLRKPLAKSPLGEGVQQQLETIVKKNIKRALAREGFGAKTALGFGRFEIIGEVEPDAILQEAKKRAEKREKEKIARQKARQIAAMTEAERLAFNLKGKELGKKEIDDIFNKLESFSKNDRMLVAKALMEYWQHHKAWSRKDFSNKQWKKVRDRINNVKQILGLG